ncbi:unnamed protein product [Nezara viridula]|uniref:Uncharacterized protein n=1 Tax=Nezara viridula TaxID=85310 RepID=A0A9P0GZA3_NEZVI|nr:unnamed protein product [Nezara viridula]
MKHQVKYHILKEDDERNLINKVKSIGLLTNETSYVCPIEVQNEKHHQQLFQNVITSFIETMTKLLCTALKFRIRKCKLMMTYDSFDQLTSLV